MHPRALALPSGAAARVAALLIRGISPGAALQRRAGVVVAGRTGGEGGVQGKLQRLRPAVAAGMGKRAEESGGAGLAGSGKVAVALKGDCRAHATGMLPTCQQSTRLP